MTLTQTLTSNDEKDSLDDLVFLRAVTTRSGRMVRVIYDESDLGTR